MSRRSDPLVPVLGTAVTVIVIGAIGFIFYPRMSRWFGPDKDAVYGRSLSPVATVPVWICRSVDGVALLLEASAEEELSGTLDSAFEGGPYRLLRLTAYNFARDEAFDLRLDPDGFASPEGGPKAVPAAARLRPDLPATLTPVLRGLGAVLEIRVPRGHRGHVLLVLPADPGERRSFASGELMFERRELPRRILAAWQRRPDLKEFLDF